MLYGTSQAGFNPPPNMGLNISTLQAGGFLTLLNGKETIVSGSASVSFARGYKDGGGPPLTFTFTVSGCAANSVVKIQASDTDIAANYQTLQTITGNGFYTDIGNSAFYRALVSTFNSPDTPNVTVKA